MSMLSFYGGPAGKDFTIAAVFANKAAMDADLKDTNSKIFAGDYVLISYGDPNSTKFSDNLTIDGDKSYNATLWKKNWDSGYTYDLICSVASSYPKFSAGSLEASLKFGSAPQLDIDSSTLASPKVNLKMPASLTVGSSNTTKMVLPTASPKITPVYGGTLENELSFEAEIPQGTTFTPSVSDAGVISWTNNGNLANPVAKNIKGQKGDTGVGFAGVAYTATSESGGYNTFKIKYDNGTTGTDEYKIRNGIDVINAEVATSTADAGTNTYTFIKSDGSKISPSLTVKNGSKGNTGTIKSVSATVDANVGTPNVTATLSGDTSNADIAFTFKNLKGQPGAISGMTATVDTTSIEEGNPVCTVTTNGTPENRSFALAFSHLVGKKGDTGSAGDLFVPTVNASGDISWTRTQYTYSGTPETQNIKGPKGDGGTIKLTAIIDDASSEAGTPNVEINQTSSDLHDAAYSLYFHNLVGKQGKQGERGYYYTPSVDVNGDISWSNNGSLANPTTVNIRGPQGEIGNPLNIIANEEVTSDQVPEDTTVAVGAELTARGRDPQVGELVAVTYIDASSNSTSYWYFKINGAWEKVQLSGNIGSVIVNKKITDDTADAKVYSAAYINALETRLVILEETLEIGKLS